MRFWIDTEFNEFRGELISIALVGEDASEFYEVLPPPACGYGPWVAKNVVPILNKPPITLPELQAKLHAFLAPHKAAHLVADWPEDHEHFLHLLIVGPGERIGPDSWSMEVRRDLPNTADASSIPHNALEDAKALRACHLMLEAAHRLNDSLCVDGKNPRGCWRLKCQLSGACAKPASGVPSGCIASDGTRNNTEN